jgi:predicted HTH domain antitoxin
MLQTMTQPQTISRPFPATPPTIGRDGDFWLIELQAILHTGPWPRASDVLQAALNSLLAMHPDLCFAVAAELYRREQVSLSRAAEIADTDLWSFKDYLYDHDIPILMPEHSAAEMDAMIEAFEQAVAEATS